MNRPPIRLLLSARDPGAAAHIREVAAAALADPRFEVSLIAASPALERLRESGFAVREFSGEPVSEASDPRTEQLLREARAWQEEIQPDALIVGTSGPGLGVDEALIAMATTSHHYMIQDYPGYVVPGFGRFANCYFAIDEAAAALTVGRGPARLVVAGLPKYVAYDRLDPVTLRSVGRSRLGWEGLTITFYGQPLWDLPGYAVTIQHLAKAIAGSLSSGLTVYRPHPKETTEQRAYSAQLFQREGVNAILDPAPNIEISLCSADIVCTCFSTCGEDQIHLQRVAARPLGVVIYLLVEDDLRQQHISDSAREAPPRTEEGMALLATRCEDIKPLLCKAVDPVVRERLWRAAQEELPSPELAVRTILDTVKQDCMASKTSINVFTPPRGASFNLL
jgi:hypothetical protein